MRFLISKMAASIAGETNFLSDGGGLALQREGDRKTRSTSSRGNEMARIILAVHLVLEEHWH